LRGKTIGFVDGNEVVVFEKNVPGFQGPRTVGCLGFGLKLPRIDKSLHDRPGTKLLGSDPNPLAVQINGTRKDESPSPRPRDRTTHRSRQPLGKDMIEAPPLVFRTTDPAMLSGCRHDAPYHDELTRKRALHENRALSSRFVRALPE
jgi:hypothetical protein